MEEWCGYTPSSRFIRCSDDLDKIDEVQRLFQLIVLQFPCLFYHATKTDTHTWFLSFTNTDFMKCLPGTASSPVCVCVCVGGGGGGGGAVKQNEKGVEAQDVPIGQDAI